MSGREWPDYCRNLQVASESQLWLARRWLAGGSWWSGGGWWLSGGWGLWKPVTDIGVGLLAQADGSSSGLVLISLGGAARLDARNDLVEEWLRVANAWDINTSAASRSDVANQAGLTARWELVELGKDRGGEGSDGEDDSGELHFECKLVLKMKKSFRLFIIFEIFGKLKRC